MSATELYGDVPEWAARERGWEAERVDEAEVKVWAEDTVSLPARARDDGWHIAAANSAAGRTFAIIRRDD